MEKLLNIFVLVFLPIAAGLVIFSGLFRNNVVLIRRFAKWFNLFYLLYCGAFFLNYNTYLQFDYSMSPNFHLIPQLGAKLSFATDLLGALLCTVLAFVFLMCLICAKSTVLNKHRIFYSFALFLETSAVALLCAQDFYIFICALLFEIFCVYILITNFSLSKTDKFAPAYVSLNFLGAGLLTMVLGVLYAIFANNQIDLNVSNLINSSETLPTLICFIASCAFLFISALKIPIFPFHKPLLGIIENSNPATIFVYITEFLLGFFILLKFNMYAFSEIFGLFAPTIAVLGIINVCYFGLLALKQVELKKSFAYFCFSQSAILLIALSSLSLDGICGAIFQAISCSIVFAGLFLCFSFIAQIFKTSKLPLLGGLLTRAPKLAGCTFILILITAGVPLASGFVGKFLCILGGFSTQISSQDAIWTSTFFIATGFILGTLYLIKVFQKVFFGPNILGAQNIKDLLRHRFMALCIISIVSIALGVIPYIILGPLTKYADMIISAFSI